MKLKISNIKFFALDNLINSNIISDNTQIIFGDKKKLYKQSSEYKIYTSLDSIVIPTLNICINTVSISYYNNEESDYLPSIDVYIISDLQGNEDNYIECNTALTSAIKNYAHIIDVNNLICDITINI